MAENEASIKNLQAALMESQGDNKTDKRREKRDRWRDEHKT